MSRKNGKRHGDKLVPSHPSVTAGAVEIENQYLRLCGEHGRRGLGPPLFPKKLDKEVLLWRRLMVRHRRKDFRHTESELAALEALANWTLDVWHDLHGTPRPDVKLIDRGGE